MQLHELKPKTKQATARRVGRGGKRGKTSGRGHKGQKARAGHSIRPAVRDTIKKLPKLRGRGKNLQKSHVAKPVPVNLAALEMLFANGEQVSPKLLIEKGAVRKRGNKTPAVKILGHGTLTKKVTVSNCGVSESARVAIEKAGGSVL